MPFVKQMYFILQMFKSVPKTIWFLLISLGYGAFDMDEGNVQQYPRNSHMYVCDLMDLSD